jgi:hypothetical protein
MWTYCASSSGVAISCTSFDLSEMGPSDAGIGGGAAGATLILSEISGVMGVGGRGKGGGGAGGPMRSERSEREMDPSDFRRRRELARGAGSTIFVRGSALGGVIGDLG